MDLDLAAFGAALDDAFPDVRYETRQGRQLRLSFWAMTHDGIEFTGFAGNEGRDTVVLTDNTADEAAVFIAWLRDTFLPSPDLIRFSSEPAVDAAGSGLAGCWAWQAQGVGPPKGFVP